MVEAWLGIGMSAGRVAAGCLSPLGSWDWRGAPRAVRPQERGPHGKWASWGAQGRAPTVQGRALRHTAAETTVGGAPLRPVEESEPDSTDRARAVEISDLREGSLLSVEDATSEEGSLLSHAGTPQVGPRSPRTDGPRAAAPFAGGPSTGAPHAGGPSTRLYEAFMDAQLQFLQGLPGFEELPLPEALAAQISAKLVPQGPWGTPEPMPAPQREGPASSSAPSSGKMRPRVDSRLFRTQRLRRVRFTYFDGGSAVQAFNSLCYPEHSLDVPLLGIDLLAFGQDKILCVVDMQPVTGTHHSLESVSAAVAAVKQRHGALFQSMSSRFFLETRFFSPYMLLFRSTQGWRDPVLQFSGGDLSSAFFELMQLYHQLLDSAPMVSDPERVASIQRGQSDYDTYFSTTDPAIALFNTYFGEAWSERYTREFLFPELRR